MLCTGKEGIFCTFLFINLFLYFFSSYVLLTFIIKSYFVSPKTPGSLKISRDELGNLTSMKGVSAEMLDWMTKAFDFT